ncbi:MAG: hypothetical protein KDE53_26055, partial [Caldilineaceae bacterium]|nr:hypothetical protein [Caldilineaceae bacterium]
MRIAAAEKLGFYPTPPHTLQLITNLLKPAVHGGFFRLLDPCAGEGEALAQVVSSLAHPTNTVASYGVELSDARAQAASEVLTSCIQADWQDVTTSHNSFSLIWVNPPYDTEASSDVTTKRNRLEYTFLRNTLKTLQPGGLLVYIVPLKLLERANVAAFLAGYFAQLQVFALPPAEFAQFGQIVLFGYKKENPQKDEPVMRWLQQLAITQDVPCLTDAQEPLRVPISTLSESKFFMRKITLYPQEVYTVITTHGLHTTAAWRDMNALANDGAFQPVVPLRTGHIGSMISSGQMGTILLNGHGDKPLLAKGRSIKVSETVDDKGNVVKSDAETAAKERERFETRVFTLDGEGVFTNLESVGDLQRFLESNASAIAQVMQERYAPLYAQPTEAEWRQLAPLLKSKKLPGRAGAGLLPAQKHVAIAGSRCLQQLGYRQKHVAIAGSRCLQQLG